MCQFLFRQGGMCKLQRLLSKLSICIQDFVECGAVIVIELTKGVRKDKPQDSPVNEMPQTWKIRNRKVKAALVYCPTQLYVLFICVP